MDLIHFVVVLHHTIQELKYVTMGEWVLEAPVHLVVVLHHTIIGFIYVAVEGWVLKALVRFVVVAMYYHFGRH